MSADPPTSTPALRPAMSSPAAPLLRPPMAGALRPGSGTRTPRLGLSIPPSPNQKAVQGNSTVPDLPPLQRPSSRPAAPQLRLATPQGSNTTPQDTGSGRPSLHQLSIGGNSASDTSARSRSDSFGMLDGRYSGPSSASSAERSAGAYGSLGGNGRLRQAGVATPDPGSAISSLYGENDGGHGMERAGSGKGHTLPDLDQMAMELGRELDVDDLDDDGWYAASKAGKIVELGTLGEGAGGAVTRCRLQGGKTVFALKVG